MHIKTIERIGIRKMNSKPRNEQGFTLLEVIIAMGLLTFGLLAVASMQIGAIQGNSFAARTTEGVTWAQDKMEDLLALSYDDLDDNDSPEQQGDYAVAWTVADDDPIANTKRITVTVTWQDKGRTKQAQLTCIKPQV